MSYEKYLKKKKKETLCNLNGLSREIIRGFAVMRRAGMDQAYDDCKTCTKVSIDLHECRDCQDKEPKG
jgi:hypothetical protein